jgi:hypothetical protein
MRYKIHLYDALLNIIYEREYNTALIVYSWWQVLFHPLLPIYAVNNNLNNGK